MFLYLSDAHYHCYTEAVEIHLGALLYRGGKYSFIVVAPESNLLDCPTMILRPSPQHAKCCVSLKKQVLSLLLLLLLSGIAEQRQSSNNSNNRSNNSSTNNSSSNSSSNTNSSNNSNNSNSISSNCSNSNNNSVSSNTGSSILVHFTLMHFNVPAW